MATLERNAEVWQSRNVAVVVVSFGVEAGAVNWLKQTGCKLDLYLDPDRKLYRALGLHRSLKKVHMYLNCQKCSQLVHTKRMLEKIIWPNQLPLVRFSKQFSWEPFLM